MRKRTIAISLSVLAAAALGGGAYAATQSSSNPQQAFINDVARRLHVSPARLSGALKQAAIDRINAAVAAGRLSPAAAKIIKQRIEQSSGFPLLPGMVGRPGFGFRLVAPWTFGPPGKFGPPGMFGPPAILSSAASYLGLNDKQLVHQLRSGKTLAQIASAQGKSKAGLESALTAGIRSQLEKAVKAGRLPQTLEQRLLRAFSAHVKDIVNGTRLGLMGHPWGGFAGPPPPGGARGQVPRGAGLVPAPPGADLGPLPPPVIGGWTQHSPS
jgi:hypothetical protein